ncbi:hypothetical protein ON062_08455 [Microbacterium sp. C7(2022)]|nr:hypothetical protein [Microbacterium sp. C7(2022)]
MHIVCTAPGAQVDNAFVVDIDATVGRVGAVGDHLSESLQDQLVARGYSAMNDWTHDYLLSVSGFATCA